MIEQLSESDLLKRIGRPKVSRMKRVAKERAARIRAFTKALNAGKTIEQISAEQGISPGQIRRALRLSGVHIPGAGPGNYCLVVRGRTVGLKTLDRLAVEWRCDRPEAVSLILAGCLRDDGKLAHMARRAARKRAYSKNGKKPG